ncbi:MAG: S49 family peptidase [Asticcacaulis sp.]|nr:S49 family peptidase [Asticcacaulis sp.]
MAAQGDRISAPKVGLVGSIGAVIVHADYSGAYEQAGIKVEAIQFGEEKTAGAYWKPLSASARADLQAEIDQCGRDFVADVATGRPVLTPEALIATRARVYMGDHDDPERSGLSLGFVDAIETEEEAFQALLATFGGSTVAVTLPAGQTTGETQAGQTQAKMETEMFKSAQLHPKTTASADDQAKPEDDAETDGGESEDEDVDDPDTHGDDDADDDDTGDDEAPKEPEAAIISRSPEAKTHPQLALAAIGSGQTYAQFKANVAAVPAEGTAGAARTSPLRDAMAGVKRVGADGDKKAETPGSGLVKSAKDFRRKS